MSPEKRLLLAITEMIPQWYSDVPFGPNKKVLSIDQDTLPLYSLRPFIRQLNNDFLGFALDNLGEWQYLLKHSSVNAVIELMQEQLCLQWLLQYDSSVNWRVALDYFRSLIFRTYENTPISLNLKITKNEGEIEISDPRIQKYLDPLATSPGVFLKVDKNFRVVSYDEIPSSAEGGAKSEGIVLTHLYPFPEINKSDEYSMHLTKQGDLVIMNHDGMIAAKRKGRWFLYSNSLSNSIADILNVKARFARNLCNLIFDLSYMRKGALLVYDPDKLVYDNLYNAGTQLFSKAGGLFFEDLRDIDIGNRKKSKKTRTFFEVASMDGSILFDTNHLIAVGAFIKNHENVEQHPGTRTTAAHSAFYYKGIPIKISADGHISIIFESKDDRSLRTCKAILRFL